MQQPRMIPLLELGERLIYWLVASLLVAGALVYLGYTVVRVTEAYLHTGFTEGTLELLNGSLLALMLAQIVYTTINFLETGLLHIEPVLIVGIIAAVRRILVMTATLSAQEKTLPPAEFDQSMVELGVLGGVTLAMAVAIYLIRKRSQPSS
ncbi:phosphate-starvation-inducible PsiE family protein [Oceanithermus sp.]